MRDRGLRSALLALLAVNVIWGLNVAFAKLAVQEIPPFTFNIARTAVSLAVLLPLGLRAGLRPALKQNWRQLAISGAIGLSITQATFALALKLAPSSVIAILNALGPLSLAFMAVFFLGERIAPTGWLGFALATAGALLILSVSPAELHANALKTILGGLIFLSGSISWSAFNVFSKRLVVTQDPVVMAAGTALFGWLGMVPLFVGERAIGLPVHVGFWGIFGIFYAGILGTAFGFLILNRALQRAEGSRVGALSYLQPVIGVSAAAVFLGERPGPSFLAGSLLVLVGIFLVTNSRIRTVAPLTSAAAAPSAKPTSELD